MTKETTKESLKTLQVPKLPYYLQENVLGVLLPTSLALHPRVVRDLWQEEFSKINKGFPKNLIMNEFH